MLKLRKEGEGMFEYILNIFLPLWLPIKAMQIMMKEIKEEKRKRKEEEEK